MNHIKDCLPELKAKINKMAADAQLELMTYGDPLYEGRGSRVSKFMVVNVTVGLTSVTKGALLLQIITKFCTDFRNAIEGKSTDLATHELYGGARINYIFSDIFTRCLLHMNPSEGMTLNDIRTAIRNATVSLFCNCADSF